MSQVKTGRAWVFGANVTTDDILPGRYLHYGNDEVGQFAMAGLDEGFAARVETGDFVVAGENFGSGSGRESAPYALLHAGIGAVIATSLARVFFRNCVNIGLPPILVDSIEGIDTGDALVVDLAGRRITNQRSGVTHPIRNLTGISLEILEAGGIVPYTKARMAERRRAQEDPCP